MDGVFEELKDDQGRVSIEGEMICWYKITYNLKLITCVLRLDGLDEENGGDGQDNGGDGLMSNSRSS